MCPPYLWGRPAEYCSRDCQRRAYAMREHMRALGLWQPPPKPEPARRVVAALVIVTVEVHGIEYERVWHGAIEGHWSVVKGGLVCV